jgi:hypothetical protein
MGGAAAAAAAAAKRRREQQEEEEMTKYSDEDLKEGWEFKIVRSNTGAFRSPATLQKPIEEETRSGWIMLEKFDDSRVRFKRPVAARGQDALMPADIDPYRTTYGISEGVLVLIIIGAVIGFMVLIAGAIALFGS